MLASRFASRSPVLRSDSPLSDDQIYRVAPSIFADAPHESRSQWYAYIPTAAVLAELRKEGFQLFMVTQTRVRDEGKREHTKHMIRLRHASQINGAEANEIVLLNSHDGTSSYLRRGGADHAAWRRCRAGRAREPPGRQPHHHRRARQRPGQHQSGRPGDDLAQPQHPAHLDGAPRLASTHHRQPRSGAATVPAAFLQQGDFKMTTRKLRLGPLPKTESTKLTFACPASLKAGLDCYAALHAQPKAARSSFWRTATDWAMMTRRGRRPLAIVPDAARSGFLPRRSYVAPSPQRRSSAKRPRVEPNPRPI